MQVVAEAHVSSLSSLLHCTIPKLTITGNFSSCLDPRHIIRHIIRHIRCLNRCLASRHLMCLASGHPFRHLMCLDRCMGPRHIRCLATSHPARHIRCLATRHLSGDDYPMIAGPIARSSGQ
jgi:hypothetical protein